MGIDHIYWTFGSAAQALAAMVAFLLAGYALVSSMMESIAAADETLREVSDELKRRYHRWLWVLMALTSAAVLVDLLVVYVNGMGGVPCALQLAGALLTVSSVIGAVLFVVTAADPGKYQRTARQMVGPSTPLAPSSAGASAADFFSEFVQIERLIRKLWQTRTDGRRISRRPGEPTLREMFEVLRLSEVLPGGLLSQLEALNQVRNLVFHGRVDRIVPQALEEVRRVRAELSAIRHSRRGECNMPTTGEKPGKGTYRCTKCGQRVVLDDRTDTLPPCPRCSSISFVKVG